MNLWVYVIFFKVFGLNLKLLRFSELKNRHLTFFLNGLKKMEKNNSVEGKTFKRKN